MNVNVAEHPGIPYARLFFGNITIFLMVRGNHQLCALFSRPFSPYFLRGRYVMPRARIPFFCLGSRLRVRRIVRVHIGPTSTVVQPRYA